MITFCSKCNINWAQLHSQDTEGDEAYEYCPSCRSTEFLEEGNDITAYIMNPVTGEIVDAETGLSINAQQKPRFRVRLQPPTPEVPPRPKQEIWEEREDLAIDAYMQNGSQGYFNSLQQTKKLK